MLSSFSNILWPSVIAAYGKFPTTSTNFPIQSLAVEKEDSLYPSHEKVLNKLMTKCYKLIGDQHLLFGGGARVLATQISEVPEVDRTEIGLRLLYVHLGHLTYLAFTVHEAGFKKAHHKLAFDMLEGYLTLQMNGSLRCTKADMISLQFKADLTFLGQLYMEHRCMATPDHMPTWSDLSWVITGQTLIGSNLPTGPELSGRSFLLNPFFRLMAPNAVPGSLDSAAWTALPQLWRVVILMLMVRHPLVEL